MPSQAEAVIVLCNRTKEAVNIINKKVLYIIYLSLKNLFIVYNIFIKFY
jgi:hypothetical protein